MIIDYIGVRPDFRAPNQFFEITISRQEPLPEFCQLVIERPGQEESYLTTNGWQANYAYLEISLRQDGSSVLGLRLSRNLLRFFQPSYNYKISLFDVNQGDLGFFVIGWNPGDDVLVPTNHEAQQINPEPPPFLPPADPVPLEPEAVLPVPVVAQREVIRCRECGGEIFSTFQQCPYCRTSLGPSPMI